MKGLVSYRIALWAQVSLAAFEAVRRRDRPVKGGAGVPASRGQGESARLRCSWELSPLWQWQGDGTVRLRFPSQLRVYLILDFTVR